MDEFEFFEKNLKFLKNSVIEIAQNVKTFAFLKHFLMYLNCLLLENAV